MYQDRDAQPRYLLVMLTSGPALQIIRLKPSGVQAFRDLARRYNPRSQTRSLAKLPKLMHLILGKSQLVSQIDRWCLRDPLESMRHQVVRCWVYKSNAPFFWREFRQNFGHTCCSPVVHVLTSPSYDRNGKLLSGETVMAAKPANVNGRSANGIDAVYGDKGKTSKHFKCKKARTEAKESTKVNKRAARSLSDIVVIVQQHEPSHTSRSSADILCKFVSTTSVTTLQSHPDCA